MSADAKQLAPVEERFILHWGEMGTRWGINRTVAQIHALLFLAAEPMNAEQIAKTLSVARSNVSTSLRELQSWGLVRSVHVLGDRRAHFESMKDVWEMFWLILEERKRREIDPTLNVLRECVSELEGQSDGEGAKRRLKDMLEFFEMVSAMYEEAQKLPTGAVRSIVRLRGRVSQLIEFASSAELRRKGA